MAKTKITDIATEALMDFLAENDLELYHAEYVKEGPDRILRIYIDKDDFVTTEDCEKVSRYLSDRLDELDPIEDNYMLEVSSPGMDRTLYTPEHFRKYIGEQVEVSLYKERNGSKKLEGMLKSYDDGDIEIEVNAPEGSANELVKLEKDIIAKVNLAVVI